MSVRDWLLIEFDAPSDCPEATLKVAGDVDAVTTAQLYSAICEVASGGGVERLVLDLHDVHFMSSSGAALLSRCRDELDSVNVDLTITGVTGPVAKVLALVGVGDRVAAARPSR